LLGDYEGLAAAGKAFVAVWGMPDGSATGQESIFFRDPPPAEPDPSPPSMAQRSSLAASTATINALSMFGVGIPDLARPAEGMFNLRGTAPAADRRPLPLALSPAVAAIDQVVARSARVTEDRRFKPQRPSEDGWAVDLLADGLADTPPQDGEFSMPIRASCRAGGPRSSAR
jgi:hypothetical protein